MTNTTTITIHETPRGLWKINGRRALTVRNAVSQLAKLRITGTGLLSTVVYPDGREVECVCTGSSWMTLEDCAFPPKDAPVCHAGSVTPDFDATAWTR